MDPLLTAANWALAELAETVTLCGTTIAALLLLKATVVTAAAAALSVAVQLLEEAPAIDVGVQTSELRVGAAIKGRLKVFEIPLSVAVNVALAVTDPLLVTGNWALLEPDGTLTVDGMAAAVMLLLNATVVAAAAGPLSVTVQLLDEVPAIEVGVQASELSVGTAADVIGTVIDPPVADRVRLLPAAVAASWLLIVMAVVWDAITLIAAMTPSAIGEAFMPEAIQV